MLSSSQFDANSAFAGGGFMPSQPFQLANSTPYSARVSSLFHFYVLILCMFCLAAEKVLAKLFSALRNNINLVKEFWKFVFVIVDRSIFFFCLGLAEPWYTGVDTSNGEADKWSFSIWWWEIQFHNWRRWCYQCTIS